MPSARPRWLLHLAYAATLAAALLVYHNGLDGKFVFDDHPAIVDNPDVLQTSPLSRLLSTNFWGQHMDSPTSQHNSYRPLTVLTFRINHHYSKLEPFAYHVTNVVLHALASVLAVRAADKLLGQPHPATLLVLGLLFATHPIHTEAVTSIVGRAEVLAGIFFLCSFLAYCRGCGSAAYGSRPESSSLPWIAVSLLACAAATLSKEQGATVAGISALFDLLAVCAIDPRALLGLGSRGADPEPDTATMGPEGEQTGADEDSASSASDPAASPGPSSLRKRKGKGHHPAASSAHPSPAAAATAAATAPPKKGGRRSTRQRGTSPTAPWIRALIVRQTVLWLGTAIILYNRFKLNTQEIIVDRKTNAANHIQDPVLRALTKNLYVTLHAWLMAWPQHLCCDWSGDSVAVFESLADIRILAVAALWLVLFALAASILFSPASQRARTQFAMAAAVMGVTFLPASGLFFEVGFVLAERVLYLPSLGFCLLLACLLERTIIRSRTAARNPLFWLLLAAAGAYAVRTLARNEDWRTERTLYARGVEVATNNAKLHHNYAYYIDDDPALKEHHLREAIRLYPPYISAYINLGVVLSEGGRYEEAVETYRRGLDMHYKHPLYSTDVGVIHRNMAAAYLRLGQTANALEQYQTCLKVRPGHEYCTSMVAQLSAQLSAQQGGAAPTADFAASVPAFTPETLAAAQHKHERVLAMFYAPWCSHCNEMKPAYAEARRMLAGVAEVGAVDCTVHQALCHGGGALDIKGYPTVMLFRGSDAADARTYTGDRSAQDLVRFARAD